MYFFSLFNDYGSENIFLINYFFSPKLTEWILLLWPMQPRRGCRGAAGVSRAVLCGPQPRSAAPARRPPTPGARTRVTPGRELAHVKSSGISVIIVTV